MDATEAIRRAAEAKVELVKARSNAAEAKDAVELAVKTEYEARAVVARIIDAEVAALLKAAQKG